MQTPNNRISITNQQEAVILIARFEQEYFGLADSLTRQKEMLRDLRRLWNIPSGVSASSTQSVRRSSHRSTKPKLHAVTTARKAA